MLKFLCLSILLSLYGRSQESACNFSVQGTVLDADTKKPIPHVVVKVKGTDRATHTNLDGEFTIDSLCFEENTLIVSCYGYNNSICEDHHHTHDQSSHIYLTEEVTEKDGVTIEATRLKQEGTNSISQDKIDKEELRSKASESLASAISDVNGVSVASTGSNVQLPIIHGLYGNRVLILNNGLKHGFQNWGSDHAPEIDVVGANSITIIKGATGVRFGPEALGGTIIVSPNGLALQSPFNVHVGTGFETNGKGINTNVELEQGFKKWSYYVNGNFTKIGDRNSPTYMLTNSGKEEKSIGIGTRYRFKKLDMKLHYSYVDQNLALLRSSIAESGNAFVNAINGDEPIFIRPFSYDIKSPNQLTKHHFTKAEVSWWYREDSKFTFIAGRQINKRQEYDVRKKIELPIIDLNLTTSDYQLEWKHPEWKNLDGIISAQFFTQLNDNIPGTGTTPFIPNYKTLRYSAFIVESMRFTNNTFEFGARFDHEQNYVAGRTPSQDVFRDDFSFTNATASIGLISLLSEKNTLRINLGTAWRTPNMSELFSFGQHGFKSSFGLLRYYTNDNGDLRTDKVIPLTESGVKPERGYKFITEFETAGKKNTHVVTAYSHYIQNYIFDRPVAIIGTVRGPMPVFIVDQADAFFVGMDYTWKKDWTNEINGAFGVSYVWSRNLSKDEVLINQPPLSANYKLSWTKAKLWKLKNSKLSIRPSYTFQQYQAPRTIAPEDIIEEVVEINTESEIFDFKDAPEGYFLLNASWNVEFKQFGFGVTVNNILNTSYRDYLNEMRYFADELGRNFIFNISYKLK